MTTVNWPEGAAARQDFGVEWLADRRRRSKQKKRINQTLNASETLQYVSNDWPEIRTEKMRRLTWIRMSKYQKPHTIDNAIHETGKNNK